MFFTYERNLMTIKNTFFITMVLAFYGWTHTRVPFAEPLYMCGIQFPSHYTAKPNVSARFKGVTFVLKNGSCQLPQDTGDFFYIVITEEVKQNPQKNSPSPLKRILHAPCRCYQIVRNSAAYCGLNQEPWLIEEIPVEAQSEVLPAETLLFLVNPAYIKKLEIVENLCNHAKYIPVLVVDPAVTEADLQESLIKSELASIDINMSHKPIAVCKRWHNNSSIALIV